MAFELAFNPPQFTEEYDGLKMRQLVEEIERLHSILTADTVGGIRTGNFDILEATNLFIRESDDDLESRAGWGQFSVDDAIPNIPIFTDDANTKLRLGRVAYGGLSIMDNTAPTTLNVSASVQITNFDTNGPSQDATPDHTNDHITIGIAGDYLVTAAVAVANAASQSHLIRIGMHINNGSGSYPPVDAHRSLAGGSTDVGSVALAGIVTLSAGDTVELWSDTDSSSNRDVIFEDVSLSVILVS